MGFILLVPVFCLHFYLLTFVFYLGISISLLKSSFVNRCFPLGRLCLDIRFCISLDLEFWGIWVFPSVFPTGTPMVQSIHLQPLFCIYNSKYSRHFRHSRHFKYLRHSIKEPQRIKYRPSPDSLHLLSTFSPPSLHPPVYFNWLL